ncbi:hypothetical protein BGZ98_000015 [Dissophora globulifera]|nr:hypothetical protein BGZ98_000015 [Dissophora globulifera]
MENINQICEQEGYPIVVKHSATLGNHAKASRDIPQGEGLLRAVPYAAEVFDNYRKRMCHVCLLYHNRGAFTIRCQDCDQVYYCSLACKTVGMDPVNGGNHMRVCRALRKLATWKSDRHAKSIIKLMLQVLMGHWRERQGVPSAYKIRKSFQEVIEKRPSEIIETGNSRAGMDNNVEMVQLAEDMKRQLDIIDLDADASLQLAAASLADRRVETKMDDQRQQDEHHHIQGPVENGFYDVLRLQTHFEDWDEEDTKDWNRQTQTVLSLLDMAGLAEIAMESGGPLKRLTSTDVKQLISALESNAFGMFDRSKKKACNVTAVQADGTMEEVTGADVLGFVNSEENRTKQPDPHPVTTAPLSPLTSTALPPPAAPPPLPPPPATVTGDVTDGSPTLPLEDDDGLLLENESEDTQPAPDPYDSRIGEFRVMTFYAIKDIAKGQDITISYIDTDMPLHARRLALLSDYHFHCCCERCLREEKSTGSSSAATKKATKSSKGNASSTRKEAQGGGQSKAISKKTRKQSK